MFQISTKVRNDLLDNDCLQSILTSLGAEVRLYSGTVPASPDDAIGSATLLCTVSGEGTGADLAFGASAVNGVLSKDPAQIWKGTCIANGTASFYRMVAKSDTGAADPSAYRLQGSIGTVMADLLLASTSLTIGQEQRIDYFAIGMPGN